MHPTIPNNFRPTKPQEWHRNEYEWLTNEGIENVMQELTPLLFGTHNCEGGASKAKTGTEGRQLRF